jgi:hypothetical protein
VLEDVPYQVVLTISNSGILVEIGLHIAASSANHDGGNALALGTLVRLKVFLFNQVHRRPSRHRRLAWRFLLVQQMYPPMLRVLIPSASPCHPHAAMFSSSS